MYHNPQTQVELTLIKRKQWRSSLLLIKRSTDLPMYSASFWNSVFVSSSVSGLILFVVLSSCKSLPRDLLFVQSGRWRCRWVGEILSTWAYFIRATMTMISWSHRDGLCFLEWLWMVTAKLLWRAPDRMGLTLDVSIDVIMMSSDVTTHTYSSIATNKHDESAKWKSNPTTMAMTGHDPWPYSYLKHPGNNTNNRPPR
jgi:hypothetical protein